MSQQNCEFLVRGTDPHVQQLPSCTSTSSAGDAITSCGLELLALLQIPKSSEWDSNPECVNNLKLSLMGNH
jgi:hypothetical protein